MDNLAYKYEEGIKEEMLDGKIYAMAPPLVNHSMVSLRLSSAFFHFLKGKKCQVFHDWGYVYFSKKDRVQPDIMVICNRDIIKNDGVYGTPDLIIEILSRSTAKRDKTYKKNLYEKHGVSEYWIVDPKSFIIEVYLLKDEKYQLDDVYAWEPDEFLKNSTEDEKNHAKYDISPALFPELVIKMEDIFGGWLLKEDW